MHPRAKKCTRKSPRMPHADTPRRPQPRPHHACRGKQQQRRCSCSLASAPWGVASPALLSSVAPEARVSRPRGSRLSVRHGARGGWACNGARVAPWHATSFAAQGPVQQSTCVHHHGPSLRLFLEPKRAVTPRHRDPRCRQAARPRHRTRLSSRTSMCLDRGKE